LKLSNTWTGVVLNKYLAGKKQLKKGVFRNKNGCLGGIFLSEQDREQDASKNGLFEGFLGYFGEFPCTREICPGWI
jgi:hypothetical protein